MSCLQIAHLLKVEGNKMHELGDYQAALEKYKQAKDAVRCVALASPYCHSTGMVRFWPPASQHGLICFDPCKVVISDSMRISSLL